MDRPNPVRLSRAELKIICGDNDKLIRAFESYIKALAELTPDELVRIEEVAAQAGFAADSAAVIAISAQALAAQNAELLTHVETLETRINTLQAQFARLARSVSDLYEAPL